MAKEETLLIVRPSMWRNKPIRFTILIGFLFLGIFLYLSREMLNRDLGLALPDQILPVPGLLVVGIAVLKLVLWWLKSIATRLIVTPTKIFRHDGILAKHMVHMRHENIQNVYVIQSAFQRLMRCGRVAFSSSGQANIEIAVDGIPNPKRVADKIESILDR